METLAGRCVDALVRAVLAADEHDEASDATDAARLVAALVEQLELLPPALCECFALRVQHHSLQRQRRSTLTNYSTEVERALWAALVDRQWLTHLRAAALPAWLQGSPTDVEWASLPPLQALDVSGVDAPHANTLATFFLDSLPLHALRSLNLRSVEAVTTDAPLLTIATQCHQLEHLDVRFCPHASDTALGALVTSNHETLLNLQLSGLRQLTATNALIDAIELCSSLETLALNDYVGLSRLPRLPTSITALDCHGLTQFTDNTMRTMLSGSFHRLQRLSLGESELRGDSLTELVRLSPGPTALVALDLSWCQHITSEAITEVVRRSPSLTALVLRCTAIDDAVLEAIDATLSHLRKLDLERCDGLTSEGFGRFAQATDVASPPLRHLEKLNLSWTNVTSAALVAILSHCSSGIRKLRLQGCRGVDRALLDAISSKRPWPRLELVDFAWTSGAADEQLERLAQQVPHAKWIRYYGTQVG